MGTPRQEVACRWPGALPMGTGFVWGGGMFQHESVVTAAPSLSWQVVRFNGRLFCDGTVPSI